MHMAHMKDIRGKSEGELTEMVQKARVAIREERFKDKFSRKASVITKNKKEIAQVLTELSARRNNKTN